MPLELNGGLHVHCDGRRERCSTTLSTAGGYVVAVTSVFSDRSVALASSGALGHPASPV